MQWYNYSDPMFSIFIRMIIRRSQKDFQFNDFEFGKCSLENFFAVNIE